MRLSLCLVLVLSGVARATEAQERAAIDGLVANLNATPANEALFAPGFDGAEDLRQLSIGFKVVISHEPWREATVTLGSAAPHLIIASVRFITPGLAIVDTIYEDRGDDPSHGSQYNRAVTEPPAKRIPVLIVAKKDKSGWRIASLRQLPH